MYQAPSRASTRRKFSYRMLFSWVTITTVAGIFASIFAHFIARSVWNMVLGTPLLDYAPMIEVLVAGATVGTFVSLLQLPPLQRLLPIGGSWVVVSGIGYALAAVVSYFVVTMFPPTAYFFMVKAALMGAGWGCAQWLVLRRTISSALWWIPASMIAMFAREIMWQSMSGRTERITIISAQDFAAWAAGWFVYSVVSGAVLIQFHHLPSATHRSDG